MINSDTQLPTLLIHWLYTFSLIFRCTYTCNYCIVPLIHWYDLFNPKHWCILSNSFFLRYTQHSRLFFFRDSLLWFVYFPTPIHFFPNSFFSFYDTLATHDYSFLWFTFYPCLLYEADTLPFIVRFIILDTLDRLDYFSFCLIHYR